MKIDWKEHLGKLGRERKLSGSDQGETLGNIWWENWLVDVPQDTMTKATLIWKQKEEHRGITVDESANSMAVTSRHSKERTVKELSVSSLYVSH